MTAFARAERTEKGLAVAVEIRSYNSKHLDIALRVPDGYSFLEDRIKGLISTRVTRGRIEVNLQVRVDSDALPAFEIDESKAAAYHKIIVQLKNRFDIDTEIPLSFLMAAEVVIKSARVDRDIEVDWSVIRGCISEAVDDLDKMRRREGNFIIQDIIKRLDFIEKSIDRIERESGDLLSCYQKRLKERIAVLTNGVVELDAGRIAQEAAFFANRSDISEEIVRARSHTEQFRAIMDSEGSSGRKLNFLLQEFNREFNTISSKATGKDVPYIIVAVKSELEKIKEQVQNVE